MRLLDETIRRAMAERDDLKREVEALRAQFVAAEAILLGHGDEDLCAAAQRAADERTKLRAERDALRAERDALRVERDALRVELSRSRDVGASLVQRLKNAHHDKQPSAPLYAGPGRQLAVCLDPATKVWAIQGPDGWEIADASWEVMAPWWLDPRERARIRPAPEMYRG